MKAYPYLSPWLQCLLQLAPPRGLIHVGAGCGSQEYPFQTMPRLLVLEADAQQCARLQTQLQNHADSNVMQVVLGDQSGSAEFFTLSQSLESGLCSPTVLQSLWPNIKALRTEVVSTSSLTNLLTHLQVGSTTFNWAVFDCMPAGPMLEGAGALLNIWDVLVVRALRDTPSGADVSLASMGLPSLRQKLAAFDLEYVACEEENHPLVVRALFVRNQSKKIATAQATMTAVQAQLDKTAQEKAELITLRDLETKAKVIALQQRDALATNLAALAVVRDEQARLAVECQEALVTHQSHTADTVLAKAKLDSEYADLARTRDELVVERDKEAREKAETLALLNAETKVKEATVAQYELRLQELTANLEVQISNLTQEKTKLLAEQTELVVERDKEAKKRDEALSMREAEIRLKEEVTIQCDQRVKEQASNFEAQITSLTQEKTKLNTDYIALAKVKDELVVQRDNEAKAKAEALALRDAETKAGAEVLTKYNQLAVERTAISAARDEQAKLATDRQTELAELQKNTETKTHRIQQLEAENQEHAARLHVLQEELIKAEAQIELIKDLLLREPGF